MNCDCNRLATSVRFRGMAGAQIPRKSTTSKSTREAVQNTAVQIGIVIAAERNRRGQNQTAFAGDINNVNQGQVSLIERGKPAGLTSNQVDRVFDLLGMRIPPFDVQRAFLKWWQLQ